MQHDGLKPLESPLKPTHDQRITNPLVWQPPLY